MVMKQLTLNNHFKFGYNGHWFNDRVTEEDNWMVEYGKCARTPFDFHKECVETTKIIYDNTDLPIWICFSGGVDSEIVVQSFIEAKIPFNIAILEFKYNLNAHDTYYAKKFCDERNLEYKLIELELGSFWDNEMYDYAERTKCVTPQLISTMWLVDQIDGYPILGSGECYIRKDIPEDYVPGESPYERSKWYMWEREKIASWYRHFIVNDREGSPGFFQYTPELMLSFLNDSMVQDLVNDRIHGKLSTMTSKLAIYQKYFELEDRKKYSGFEKVREYDRLHRIELTKLYGMFDAVHKTEYNKLVKQLKS